MSISNSQKILLENDTTSNASATKLNNVLHAHELNTIVTQRPSLAAPLLRIVKELGHNEELISKLSTNALNRIHELLAQEVRSIKIPLYNDKNIAVTKCYTELGTEYSFDIVQATEKKGVSFKQIFFSVEKSFVKAFGEPGQVLMDTHASFLDAEEQGKDMRNSLTKKSDLDLRHGSIVVTNKSFPFSSVKDIASVQKVYDELGMEPVSTNYFYLVSMLEALAKERDRTAVFSGYWGGRGDNEAINANQLMNGKRVWIPLSDRAHFYHDDIFLVDSSDTHLQKVRSCQLYGYRRHPTATNNAPED
jgi:hypothetical protein